MHDISFTPSFVGIFRIQSGLKRSRKRHSDATKCWLVKVRARIHNITILWSTIIQIHFLPVSIVMLSYDTPKCTFNIRYETCTYCINILNYRSLIQPLSQKAFCWRKRSSARLFRSQRTPMYCWIWTLRTSRKPITYTTRSSMSRSHLLLSIRSRSWSSFTVCLSCNISHNSHLHEIWKIKIH